MFNRLSEARVLVDQARQLAGEGKHEQALAFFRRALEMDFGSWSAAYGVGRELVVLRRDEEALPYLESAVRLAPWGSDHWAALGKTLATAYEAMRRELAQTDPQDARARVIRGRLQDRDWPRDAVDCLRKAAHLSDRSAQRQYALAKMILTYMPEAVGEAGAALAEAARLDPSYAVALREYERVYLSRVEGTAP